MPPEIVMVVEDEDAYGTAGALAKEVRRREPAEASAHHHQVVFLAGVDGRGGRRPEAAVPKLVGGGVGAFVAPAQPGEGRRVVARRLLGRVVQPLELEQGAAAYEGGAGGEGHAVQEIPAADPAIHPEAEVARIAHGRVKVTRLRTEEQRLEMSTARARLAAATARRGMGSQLWCLRAGPRNPPAAAGCGAIPLPERA